LIRPLQVLKARFAAAQGLPMEDRLFQHLSLAAAVLSLFLVIPINYLQDLPPVFNLIIFAFGLGSWALYQRSVAGHPHKKTFALAVAVVLNLSWFTDGGSQGSIGMFFYTGVMIIAIFFRRRLRWAMLTAFTLNILLLLSLDHLHPGWSIAFKSPSDRYWDLVSGFLLSVVAGILILLVVLTSYDAERKQQAALNQELKRSLDEIRTLQGLLPICSWCKKVRDDEGLWTQVEQYLSERTDLSFTHGMCPTCAHEHFPGGYRAAEGKSGPVIKE
jgi:hypothetical protein